MNAPVPLFDLIGLPHTIDLSQRIDTVAPVGCTVAEAVAIALPGATEELRRTARVVIEGHVIPVANWRLVRPKVGAVVIVRLIPRGGNLRTVLQIAVTVAAIAATFFLTGPLGAFGAALVGAGVSVVGNLLINAFIPVKVDDPTKTGRTPSPTYSATGWRNQENPDAPIPVVLGKHRLAPVFGARSFTEWSGDRQFLVARFLVGYGPLKLRKIRIGDTTFATDAASGPVNFKDCLIGVREGRPADAAIGIYTNQVLQEDLNIGLRADTGREVRQLARDCTQASVDIAFPNGLVRFDSEGNPQFLSVVVNIYQRRVGGTVWALVQSLNFYEKKQESFVRTHRWTLSDRTFDWEIGVSRMTPDDIPEKTDSRVIRTVAWTALRGYRPESPVAFDKKLAEITVRIRASKQLNGVLDTLTVEASSECLDYDSVSGTWVSRETRNPASLYRYALQGPMVERPIADEDIDLDAIEDWHNFCRVNSLHYDRVHDYDASLWDVLTDIAAAGRATPRDTGTQWSVVIDRTQTVVIAHISPRNSWNFSGERSYARLPDAFRIPFRDSERGYEESERLVPRPDLIGEPLITEELPAAGLTEADAVWNHGMWRWGELLYRADTYTVNQDFEHLPVARGDMAILHHDALDRAEVTARIINVNRYTEAGATVTALVELDEPVRMNAITPYGLRFRSVQSDPTNIRPMVSTLRTVQNYAGTTTTPLLRLTGTGRDPNVGDLAFFGPITKVSREVLVRLIESGENLSARLTLVDHAPEIEALLEDNPPPPFDGRYGEDVIVVPAMPLAPIIQSIVSGEYADSTTNEILVTLKQDAKDPVPLESFVIETRRFGNVAWFEDVIAASQSAALIANGFNSGVLVQVRAKAVSLAGIEGPYTAIYEHTIGTTSMSVPEVPPFASDAFGAFAFGT